jgi:tetratricopeptide (TPR) repeat protein
LLEKSLSVSRKFRLKDIEADSLDTLAVIALRQGEYQKANTLFQESLAIWRDLENSWWQAAELICLAHVARSLGHPRKAEQYSEEALLTFRESGNHWGIVGALNARGAIARERQEYDRAMRCYQEGLEISREIGYKYGIARASLGLAQVAYQLRELERAREHCQTSLAVFTELGKRIETPSVLTVLGGVHAAQEDVAEAKKCFRKALEIASSIEATPEFLRALVGMAPLLAREGEEKKAIQLLKFATTQPEIKSSDQEKASKLLKDLISVHPPDGDLPEPERMEDMGFSEIMESFFDNQEVE